MYGIMGLDLLDTVLRARAMAGKYGVYLAGPITGCTYGECTDWRKEFAAAMPEVVECFSPMRFKKHLDNGEAIADNYPQHVLCSQRGIMSRDYFDCSRADLGVFNFLGATRVSIGTVMEIAWCFAHRIPTVVVMEKEGNIHEHSMLREAISFRVESLEAAEEVVRAILDTNE